MGVGRRIMRERRRSVKSRNIIKGPWTRTTGWGLTEGRVGQGRATGGWGGEWGQL